MTKEMYEDLLERNRLQISELNTLTEEQDKHIIKLSEENAELKDKLNNLASVAEVRLANWQKYEKENAELKAQVEKLQKEKKEIIHQEVVDMYSRFPC